MDTSPLQFLNVPTPVNESLSFCNANPRDIKDWLDNMPKANLGETARQLYQGLIELNQLKLPLDVRLQLLELFRPDVHYVCQHLERHFLNQSIVLDERPRKIANLCQALQNHLAIGYKLVVVREASRAVKERAVFLATAIQRAIRSLCGPLVRASQLYCPVPEGLWQELHQLYQLARIQGLQSLKIQDALSRQPQGLNIKESYVVALMLGSARCNQMRQNNIARLATVLEDWAALVRIQPADLPSSLFAVAPEQDQPPRYRGHFKAEELPGNLGIDPSPLVSSIKEYLALAAEKRSQSSLKVGGITLDLLQHLAAAWGDVSERSFQRTPGQGQLTVCIGMSALHYFLAGKQHFAKALKLKAPVRSTFKAGENDPWSDAFDAQQTDDWQAGMPLEEIEYTGSADTGHDDSSGDYPTYSLPIVNHSPGGSCLAWPKEVPSQLQAGELLGIQDAPEQGWSIAVVRWIRQVRDGGTQMGIELMAPLAQPCGLQLIRKSDPNSQYLRTLLLPEIAAVGKPPTLIAPHLPFQEGSRVHINLQGNEHRAALTRKLSSTGSYSQFEYQVLGPVVEVNDNPVTATPIPEHKAEEDFDSLWKSL